MTMATAFGQSLARYSEGDGHIAINMTIFSPPRLDMASTRWWAVEYDGANQRGMSFASGVRTVNSGLLDAVLESPTIAKTVRMLEEQGLRVD